MTPAEKRQTKAAIRQVARWMSDPRHRVKDWSHMYEDADGKNGFVTEEDAARTCLLGAWRYLTAKRMPDRLQEIARMFKRDAFYEPWTTAELRKLFAESIKAVENA